MYEIKSVTDLLTIVRDLRLKKPKQRWTYRGQSSHYDGKLKPSIGRLFGTGKFTDRDRLLQLEQQSFTEFKQKSYSELGDRSDLTLLAIAQHHGFKTRLLDWTTSALCALFFAVENKSHHDVDGVLYIYPPKNVNDLKTNLDPFTLSKTKFIIAPILSPRNQAQQGMFLCFSDPTEEFKDADLVYCNIPAAEKSEIKKELFFLGISYNMLFPGLDGLSSTLNYMFLQ